MAKLPRVTAKIFAENAPAEQVGQFGSALAGTKVNTTDVSQIQALQAYKNGWSSAVLSSRNYPTLEETNGLMKVLSYQTAYGMQTGLPEYDPNTEYSANTSFCQVNGTWYQSLIDNNVGNDPTTSATAWKELPLTNFANEDLSNLSTLGEQKLEAQKAYKTGNVLTDEKGYAEVVEASQSTFDLSKFEVVGSPIISDDGVASGFSATDFVKCNISANIPSTFDFYIDVEVTQELKDETKTIFILNGTNIAIEFSPVGNFFQFSYSFLNDEETATTQLVRITGAKTLIDNANIGDIIHLYKGKTSTQFISGYALNDSTFTYTTHDTLSNLSGFGGACFIGTAYSGASTYFKGKIKLSSIKLKTNGQTIFSGAQTGLDVIKPDNYEVVGSPVISEDGVASGFSNANYLSSPIDFSNANTIKIKASFRTPTEETYTSFGNVWHISGAYLTFWNRRINVFNDGGTYTIGTTPQTCDYDTDYDTIWEFNLSTFAYKLSVKKSSETDYQVYEGTQAKYTTASNTSSILYGRWNYGVWGGSIDLNSIKVYTNGNLVYQPCLKIPYTETKTGSKIVDASARSRVQDLYEQTGEALYYTLDVTNQNYTIPMGEEYGMIENSRLPERNLGEIVTSTIPLTDARLHLADGSLLQQDGVYADFVESMGGFVESNPELFTTEDEWQSSITSYGVCGKYVYDSTAKTLRLPKITGFIEGTLDATTLGDLTEAGLPNIEGTFRNGGGYSSQITGAMYYIDQNSSGYMNKIDGGSDANYTSIQAGLDASRSSSIYGNSNTVQPQAIKVYYYVVVATDYKKNASLVRVDNIVNEFNGKADVDLSNCTRPHIVETYVNDTSWYRVYSDGWCEQGGTTASSVTVSYLKPYPNTNYTIQATPFSTESPSTNTIMIKSLTASSCLIASGDNLQSLKWEAKGYIS